LSVLKAFLLFCIFEILLKLPQFRSDLKGNRYCKSVNTITYMQTMFQVYLEQSLVIFISPKSPRAFEFLSDGQFPFEKKTNEIVL